MKCSVFLSAEEAHAHTVLLTPYGIYHGVIHLQHLPKQHRSQSIFC